VTGVKTFRHPVIGEISLDFEAMELPADPGLTLTAYTAAPGTPADDALRLLASWAVTTAENAGAQEAAGPGRRSHRAMDERRSVKPPVQP
jgi:hypothetical protein